MTDDLIERLRAGVPCCDPDAGNGEGSYYVEDANDTMSQAADRIEAQAAEIERMREALEEIADIGEDVSCTDCQASGRKARTARAGKAEQ